MRVSGKGRVQKLSKKRLNGVLNLSYAEPNSSPTELSRFMNYKPTREYERLIEIEDLIIRRVGL